jgi:hypothetical protein
MEIKILDVLTPSDKQKNSGILGTINLGIVNDGVMITKLHGLTVRKSKSGNYFLSEPSYPVGEGDNKNWYKHFTLYPGPAGPEGQSQRDSKDALTKEVIRILENGGTKRKEATGAVASTAPKAADPWDSGI